MVEVFFRGMSPNLLSHRTSSINSLSLLWIVVCSIALEGHRTVAFDCNNTHQLAIVGHHHDYSGPALGDGCTNVFLDIGGNMGMQARKLFEPALYPPKRYNSSIYSKFARIFGPNSTAWRESVCVIGFEPNPAHHARLRQLAHRYSTRGWRTTYLLAAVGVRNTTAVFRGNQSKIQAAGKLVGECEQDTPGENRSTRQLLSERESAVAVVNLAEFLRVHISSRRRPKSLHGKVLAKVDIENAEYELFSSFLAQDSVDPSLHAIVDLFLVEWHSLLNRSNRDIQEKFISSAFISETLDDESYAEDIHPLPRRAGHSQTQIEDLWSTKTVKKDGAFWQNRNNS